MVVGDENTGKSAMIDQYILEGGKSFHFKHHVKTVLDMKSKMVIADKKSVLVTLWDVGGSVDHDLRERVAYSNADLIIIAYSKTDEKSLENVKVKWAKEVENCLPDVPMILVGTKKDEITDEAKEVSTGKVITSAGSIVASQINAKSFIECSSLFNENVIEVFDKGIRIALEQRKRYEKKLSKMSSRKSFDQKVIEIVKLDKYEEFLSLSHDEGCLSFLQQQDVSTILSVENQLMSLNTSALYIICQRRFVESLKYFFETFPEIAADMMVKIDVSNRTPIMVADGNSETFSIADKFMLEKRINHAYGKDSKGKDIPLVNVYIDFNIEHLAKRVIETAEREERKHFLNLQDEYGNSLLLKEETSEMLGTFIIENYLEDLTLSTKNHIDENLVHIYSKKGYKVSNILSKIDKETTFDLLSQQDHLGNTPLMASALYGNQAALAYFLTFYFERKNHFDDLEKVDEILHLKNREGHNLTYLVFIHKQELQSSYSTVHELEKYVHNQQRKEEDEESDSQDQGLQTYLKCLRENQISKMEIKSIKNTIDANQVGSKFILILVLSLGSFWFPAATYMLDVSTDSALTKDHYENWMTETNYSQELNTTYSTCNPNDTTLTDYPHCLGSQHKFIYSLAFMILPWLFYISEFLTSEIFRKLVQTCKSEGDLAWVNIQNKSLGKSFFKSYLKSSVTALLLPFVFLTWPIFTKLVHVYYIVKYRISTEEKRSENEEKMWNNAVTAARAHILEVCIESSFQPLLQWYQLFPGFLIWCLSLETATFDINQYTQELNTLKVIFSFFSSIFSLGWSFSAYKVAQKRGTLDMGSNPLGRIVLFLSNLFLILARLQSFVMFSYYFGPGNFFPIIAFTCGHVVLISILHGMFSEASVLVKSNKKQLVTLCLINGLANIFMHNYIDLDLDDVGKNRLEEEAVRWKPTLARQLLFDLIFIVENLILAFIGILNVELNIPHKDNVFFFILITIFSSHFLGLFFKFIYYKKLHAWSFLTDSTRRKGYGLSFEFKYLFCNKVRTVNIHLPCVCLIPNVAKAFLNELKRQLMRNICRTDESRMPKKRNLFLTCFVAIVSIPIYILLIIVGCVLFFLSFVFIILIIPVFLACRFFFFIKNCAKNKCATEKEENEFVYEENEELGFDDNDPRDRNGMRNNDDTLLKHLDKTDLTIIEETENCMAQAEEIDKLLCES